jgi:hypothetical protein
MNNTIYKIRRDYNPEFDYDPSAPPVPWHVAELTETVDQLMSRLDKALDRIGELEDDLQSLRHRFDSHEYNSDADSRFYQDYTGQQ